MIGRRALLGAGGGLLAAPALSQPAGARVLRFVPQADLGGLDPIAISSNVIRNHGYMVWDTLYGVDHQFRTHPHPLRPLPREQHRQPTLNQPTTGLHRSKPLPQLLHLGAPHHGPMPQHGPPGRQRPAHIHRIRAGVA